MALGKQAKIMTKAQQDAVLGFLSTTAQADRNRVIFLLSMRAGLRAKEIANVTWSMITDSEGQITDCLNLQDIASKGRSGGAVWLNSDLKTALVKYQSVCGSVNQSDTVIKSYRSKSMSAQQIVNMMRSWYLALGFNGCSSHSGRRTFITNAAKKISSVGGSIRDVQMLARHSSLQMTQRYIEADVEAQKRVVQLL